MAYDPPQIGQLHAFDHHPVSQQAYTCVQGMFWILSICICYLMLFYVVGLTTSDLIRVCLSHFPVTIDIYVIYIHIFVNLH